MLSVTHWLEICIWEPKLSLCFSELSILKGISFFKCSEAVMGIKFIPLHKKATLGALLLIVRTFDEMLIHFFAKELNAWAEGAKISFIWTLVDMC